MIQNDVISIAMKLGRAEGITVANINHIKRFAAKGKTAEEIADLLDLDLSFVVQNIYNHTPYEYGSNEC